MRQLVDLDAAVAAGIIGEDQAVSLRNNEAIRAGQPNATVEQLHLIGGLSDVMTAVGLGLVLAVMAAAAMQLPVLAPIVMTGCWLAARRFTAQRRMMASSFVLFGFFAFHITIAIVGAVNLLHVPIPLSGPVRPPDWLLALIGATAAIASYLYWRYHRMPIAVAVAAIAVIQALNNSLSAVIPGIPAVVRDLVVAGWAACLFVYAMAWDISDIRRETERSDVAFWLHCTAGFYLTQSAFAVLLGASALNGTGPMPTGALVPISVLAMYAVFCAVSLVIDRRSLVLSSLAYAIPALVTVLGQRSSTQTVGIATLIAGLFLVTLSVKWTDLRRVLLASVPRSVAAQVPRADLRLDGQRPTRRHLELGPRRTEPFRRDRA